MRALITLAAVSLCIATAPARGQDRGDEVVLTPTGDPHMEAARSQARSTLDSFFEIEKKRPAGTSGFKVKVRFSDGRYTEHFWVQQFQAQGVGYEGVLANEPKYVKTVQLGQLVKFRREDITDWGYVKEGRQIGSFTVCAALKRMPKEQVDYYRNSHGFDC